MLIREKYVSLHPLKRNNGRVAQLNRVADYGSAGYRFESCRDHFFGKQNGRVAQLNRVADYGSAGYRFESCRDHQNPLQKCRGFCISPISSKKIDIKKDILNRPLDYIQSIGCFSQTLQYLFSNIRKFIFEH